MVFRKLILIAAILAFSDNLKAQQLNYAAADSITYAQYMAGDWNALKQTGNEALNSGIDFPYLRLRIAYAHFMEANYSGALKQYKAVLKNNSFDETARLYSYWCNEYLSRTDEASYHASKLADSTLIEKGIKPFGILQLGVESSYKIPSDELRNNAFYNRIYISNRLFLKLKLEQSASFYEQRFAVRARRGSASKSLLNNQQAAYFVKMSYPITSSISLMVAYHYLHNNFVGTIYQNHVALMGVKISKPYFDIQGDANVSKMAGVNVSQFNAALTFYPKGNLDLYTVSRLSLQNQETANRFIFTQLVGTRVLKSVWLEANVTLGRLNNYMEADVLYVYNSIDQTLFKTGATAFVSLSKILLLHINYAFEQKENAYEIYKYNQQSITGGLTWKF
jgi:hypothetical protein